MPADSGSEGLPGSGRKSVLQGVLVRLNGAIRAGASRLDAADSQLSWEFRCECTAPGCEMMVTLTLADFDALRARDEPVLAPRHTVSRAPLARRKAERLRDDASALRAQAKQQRRRARRNLQGRVLLVDDNFAMRTAAAGVVSAAEELRLVGTAASGEEAIELLPELKPDFVLLDIRMPGIDGIDTAQVIRSQKPNVVVVLYSADPTALDRATRSVDAAGFLDKADLRPATLDTLWLEHRPRG